jgi:hypothetical protein
MTEIVQDNSEDQGYTRQFFTISRQGHAYATAEFGSPTLTWHVAFWPRSANDPFSVPMTEADGKLKKLDAIIADFRGARQNVVADFNQFLDRLQVRGRIKAAEGTPRPFNLRPPRDWEAPVVPFDIFDSNAIGFTLWWPDDAPRTGNMLFDGMPSPGDLRVRIQAEATIDYSAITFFIDAGKPWGAPPIYLSDGLSGLAGNRRRKIFEHVKNIKTICESRLDACDSQGKRLIDLDLLPEPNPVTGDARVGLEQGFTNSAEALKAAADYLYDDLWQEFCRDFDFDLTKIAGNTDEVFANFRGLVMATGGAETNGKLAGAPEQEDPSIKSHPGSVPFPRFDAAGEGYGSNKTEPNAVVKAFMPFMRRFRPEADWRDWIACGVFNWRAIYITAVGAQSEFAPFDESSFDRESGVPAEIPAGFLPRRKVTGAAGSAPPALQKDQEAKFQVPTTHKHDRPAPFRFLLLTKYEPHRKQVGRMVERINSLGARRLFALKDWSIIQNASVWISQYGRQLDGAYQQWIKDTDKLKKDTSDELDECNRNFWRPIQKDIDAVANEKVNEIRQRYRMDPRRACELLADLAKPHEGSRPWKAILDFASLRRDDDLQDYFGEFRAVEGNYDTELAHVDQTAERELVRITAGLDELGAGAVGGLPYRIARSRYYADTFREAQKYLRVGNIETWWSYEQFAKRGMEPALRFIASVGDRMQSLRQRLQTMKQDILQSSIASQTEATRDNTHRLERIQAQLAKLTQSTNALTYQIEQERLDHQRAINEVIKKREQEISQNQLSLARLDRLRGRLETIRIIVLGLIGGLILLFFKLWGPI